MIFPSIVALTLLLIAIMSAYPVNAQGKTYSPIIQRLSQQFNLNQEEVQNVFDDYYKERHANMFARFSERLDDFVFEGKLTKEQKELILDKFEVMQNEIEELRNLPLNERKAERQKIRKEFQDWLTGQGIKVKLFPRFREFGMHMSGGMTTP